MDPLVEPDMYSANIAMHWDCEKSFPSNSIEENPYPVDFTFLASSGTSDMSISFDISSD